LSEAARARGLEITAFDLARRYLGVVVELVGGRDHPLIVWWHHLAAGGHAYDDPRLEQDEIPWCSSFAIGQAWPFRDFGCAYPVGPLARRARSWLRVGREVSLGQAIVGWDVVVLNRGGGSPDPSVIDSPGHVGFFAGLAGDRQVVLLGGNQGDAVSVARFPVDQVLGVRRLLEVA
jgi:uncharacterized protein (TIGR02594 family)